MTSAPASALHHSLSLLLAQIESLGLDLVASSTGGVRIVPVSCDAPDPPPADLVAALRKHRATLTALLAAAPRSLPDFVPFISLKLDCYWSPAASSPAIGYYRDNIAYYRLSPHVCYWLLSAIDNAYIAKLGPSESKCDFHRQIDAELPRLLLLEAWVREHHRPDQIRRGFDLARRGLPTIPLPVISSLPANSANSLTAGKTAESLAAPNPSQPDRNGKSSRKHNRKRSSLSRKPSRASNDSLPPVGLLFDLRDAPEPKLSAQDAVPH